MTILQRIIRIPCALGLHWFRAYYETEIPHGRCEHFEICVLCGSRRSWWITRFGDRRITWYRRGGTA